MPKQRPKSTDNFETQQELILMRMSIKAIRDRMNADLDAISEQLARLTPPPENDARYQRQKNWGKKEWGLFLEGKLR